MTFKRLFTKQQKTEDLNEVKKPEQAEKANKKTWWQRLTAGLKRTHNQLAEGLSNLLLGKKVIDPQLLEEIENQLLMADFGVESVQYIINELHNKVDRKQLTDGEALFSALQALLVEILTPSTQPLSLVGASPFVILVVGVNGTGKTTTIGKLAYQFKQQGRSVLLAAGDTFRAAAIEQLQIWGERNQVPVVAQQQGADSAAVIYDALQAAQARKIDVLLVDTAGRLHTQGNLMAELQKIKRVIGKLDPSAPHEVLLVLDATIGQNTLIQAKQFQQAIDVTGIVLTKLDGTAKGGIVFAIAKQLGIPIRYIGVGEGLEDLRPFNAEEFVAALFTK